MPSYDSGATGLTGTIGVTILDAAGTEHVARTTAGISELAAGSGVYYVADHDADATLTYVWDNGVGTVGASETLYAGRDNLPNLDAAVSSVKAKTDAIGAASVVVRAPLDPDTGAIYVNQGNDYAAADGRQIAFTYAVADWPDLTGATVILKSAQAMWTAAVTGGGASAWTVTFTPTAAQTGALTVTRQSYEIQATLTSGRIIDMGSGSLVVTRDIPGAG